MNIKAYLKDKAYLIITSFIIYIMMMLFLFAVDTNRAAICIVSILFWFLILFIVLKEYHRRSSYYSELQASLLSLDQKYLLTEILKEPNFLDGRILFQTMREIDKSMCDYVNLYKHKQLDYKEYIEMWVHEIKTPLAASKLIISNHPSEVTKSIDEELDKLDGFVEQALFYARSATLEKDYAIKELTLSPIINKVIRKHSKSFIYKNIKLQLQDLDTTIYTDSKWLEFILDQIIGNALKYIQSEHGEISIYTKQLPHAIELYIQDNGIGIDEYDLPRIFDKGFTGKNGRNNESATGIGLYLCKTLCEKLYLDIRAQSHNGTTIILHFPKNLSIFY